MPTFYREKWVKDEETVEKEKVQVQVPKKVSPWFYKRNNRYYLEVRSGNKPLELQKEMHAIEVDEARIMGGHVISTHKNRFVKSGSMLIYYLISQWTSFSIDYPTLNWAFVALVRNSIIIHVIITSITKPISISINLRIIKD